MKFSKIEFGVGIFMVLGIVAAVVMSLKVAGLVLLVRLSCALQCASVASPLAGWRISP